MVQVSLAVLAGVRLPELFFPSGFLALATCLAEGSK